MMKEIWLNLLQAKQQIKILETFFFNFFWIMIMNNEFDSLICEEIVIFA